MIIIFTPFRLRKYNYIKSFTDSNKKSWEPGNLLYKFRPTDFLLSY